MIASVLCRSGTHNERTVNAAYISAADSSGQLYTLSLPDNFQPDKQYALNIYLHGAGGWYDHVGDPGGALGPIRWGFASDRPVGLIIRDADPARTVRDIMWDKNWTPAAGAFEDHLLPKVFATRKSAEEMTLEALRRASNSDFVVYRPRGEASDPVWDVDNARWHDLRASTGQGMDYYRTVLTGEELARAVARFDDDDVKLSIYPSKLVKKIVPDGRYRICIKQWTWRIKSLPDALGSNLPNIDLVRVNLYEALRQLALNNNLAKR